jgi:hypothetical protein
MRHLIPPGRFTNNEEIHFHGTGGFVIMLKLATN